MAAQNFGRALPLVLKHEGGFSNHPADPGGATMKGVTQATYNDWRRRWGKPQQSVRLITDAELKAIYKAGYWDTVNGDTLFSGVDYAAFDAAVNSGPGAAEKWLLRAVGSSDHSETVKRLCAARLAFVRSLKTWATFGKGWASRIASVEAKGVAWALSSMGRSPGQVQKDLEAEKKDASKSATKNGTAAGGTAAGGGAGATQLDPSTFDWTAWLMVGLIAAFLIFLIVFFIRKALIHWERAVAYEEEARAVEKQEAAVGPLKGEETTISEKGVE
jgi:lysozyme family protein